MRFHKFPVPVNREIAPKPAKPLGYSPVEMNIQARNQQYSLLIPCKWPGAMQETGSPETAHTTIPSLHACFAKRGRRDGDANSRRAPFAIAEISVRSLRERRWGGP